MLPAWHTTKINNKAQDGTQLSWQLTQRQAADSLRHLHHALQGPLLRSETGMVVLQAPTAQRMVHLRHRMCMAAGFSSNTHCSLQPGRLFTCRAGAPTLGTSCMQPYGLSMAGAV